MMTGTAFWKGSSSGPPVPLPDLSFWYEFDNASKITEDGTNIQEIIDSSPNGWVSIPYGNDPEYSAAGGYSKYVAGSSQALQSERLYASGYPAAASDITSGFFMAVLEFDALVNLRVAVAINYLDNAGGASNNLGQFRISGSGASGKLQYGGRMTSSSSSFTNITSGVISTGTKYLAQIYVTGGNLYFELDGVAIGNNATGDRFPGILAPSTQGWSIECGGYKTGVGYSYGGSCKIYELISYQAYDATKYAIVENYLKTKYSIA